MFRYTLSVACVLSIAASASAQVRNMNPSWSPEGTGLAFVSNRDGNPEIYVMDAEGRSLRNLSAHAGLDLSPSWSHDGRRIAFVSNRDGQNDVYVIDVPNGTVTRVTRRGDILTSALTWSPDDRWIAYGVGTHRSANIHLQRVDRSDELQLTETAGLDAAPAWSPDGRTIAFVSNRNGSLDIYGVSIDSRVVTPIVNTPAEEGWPSWSPDGRQLTFFSGREGNLEIYVAAADGSDVRNVSAHPANDFTPAWSPLGQQIAFVSDRPGPNQDIFVLHLDGKDVRRLTFGANSRPN